MTELTNSKKLIEESLEDVKSHFLKGSSYFSGDLPPYISFEPILNEVMHELNGNDYAGFKAFRPDDCQGANYNFITNKDGRFSWRPYESIHPAIYVSLVNKICEEGNWEIIKKPTWHKW